MSDDVIPFRVDVAEDALDDLRQRLRRARWPEPATDWSQGVPVDWLRDLCGYWADRYDWRRLEGRLNALPQFRTALDGVDVHFLHLPSPHRDALPLVLTHGWPGSVVEFLDVFAPLALDPSTVDDVTDFERQSLADLDYHLEWGSGYALVQGTRPQTVGYALVDSPVGQCAWIAEKYWAWTDHDGDPVEALSRDQMLDNISVYWHTATAASAARIYWEDGFPRPSNRSRRRRVEPLAVPAGVSVFPREIVRPSRRWCERYLPDLRFYEQLDRGGHFAAFEQPELFVDQVRRAFRTMR